MTCNYSTPIQSNTAINAKSVTSSNCESNMDHLTYTTAWRKSPKGAARRRQRGSLKMPQGNGALVIGARTETGGRDFSRAVFWLLYFVAAIAGAVWAWRHWA